LILNAVDSIFTSSLDRQRMFRIKFINFMIGLPLTLAACTGQNSEESKVLKEFRVKGFIQNIQDEGRTLIIDHEEMPGYMSAMTMPFHVKDPNESKDLTTGNEILFTYKVEEFSSWVEAIEKTGNQKEVPKGPQQNDQSSSLLKIGDPFPYFELIDEYGNKLQLKDYQGHVLALTFIFTRCPVPDYCPAMMRNFKEVDEMLRSDSSAPENYRLLTVSFDTKFDTPDVLNTYGNQFKKDNDNWNLAGSSDAQTIRSIGDAVGLKFSTSQTSIYSHNLRTVVLDQDGNITQIFTNENWKANELVEEIKRVSAATKT